MVIYIDFSRNISAKKDFEGDLDIVTLENLMSIRFGNENLVPGKTLIIFDEIQECPHARTSLKTFTEDGRYDVIASGSLIDVREDASRTLIPVGYEEIILLRSLDFEEFLWAMGTRTEMISEIKRNIRERTPIKEPYLEALTTKYREYLIVGGMPAAVQAYVETKKFDDANKMIKDVMNSAKEDIAKYTSGIEKNRIEECFESLPYQLACTNNKFMYTRVGGNPETKEKKSRTSSREYGDSLSWIRKAGYGNWCFSLHLPETPLESQADRKNFKIYLSDTGMLMSCYGNAVKLSILNGESSDKISAILENSVAEGLVKCGYPAYYLSRNKGTDRLEIDFVLELGPDVTAIEVESGKGRTAHSLVKVDKVYPSVTRKIVFENGNIHMENGIEHYPLFASAFIDELDPDHNENIQ